MNPFFQQLPASPEILLVLWTGGLLLAEAFGTRLGVREMGRLAMLGAALAFLATFHPAENLLETWSQGQYAVDGLAVFFHRLFLGVLFGVLWAGGEYGERLPVARREFVLMPVLAAVGMLLLAGARDLILIFVALEIVTVAFYVMVAYQRDAGICLEAGVKYLIIGALSTGFLVYGIAWVFGVSGTTRLDGLATCIYSAGGAGLPLLMGMMFLLAGVGFKLAVVPFHFWAPDVYHGAPAPVGAFLAAGSKAAGLVVLLRVFFFSGFNLFSMRPVVSSVLEVLAVATLVLGTLAALPQTNLKRLLGYSSIVHAGFLLLALGVGTPRAVQAALIYIAVYVPAALLAFTILSMRGTGIGNAEARELSGLGQRSPVLALGMLLAMVSLAGLPPLAGFAGKFSVLAAVWEGGSTVAFVAGLGSAVVSLYYYLSVVRMMYWEEPLGGVLPARSAFSEKLWVCLLSMVVVVLGVWQMPVTQAVAAVLHPLRP